ncbi:unnamed protein product [Spirodela intermedia]|uniref:Cyclin-like domain-containing protein n=1 Tax=Spirodela intermedia TaxID=51605 RepID=A0A7I8JQU0_SPIIN|nr:unnamed protein product [Spirodela intermedia]CAA6672506.1 unnamed protein product [Spirodela intermedia]
MNGGVPAPCPSLLCPLRSLPPPAAVSSPPLRRLQRAPLCEEDAGSFSDEDHWSPLCYLHSEYADETGSLAGVETAFPLGLGYRRRFDAIVDSLDSAARRVSAAWILKVAELHRFRPLTAYLAVNYMDRFLSRHVLPKVGSASGGWQLQLLAAACLSLAAKMEERLVPTLLDLQAAEASFVFEPRTVQRMEFLVLDVLDWRLRSVTPSPSWAPSPPWPTLNNIDFLDYTPSTIAAAAVICAAGAAPAPPSVDPETAVRWCAGLTRDAVVSCHLRMRELPAYAGRKKVCLLDAVPQTRSVPPAAAGSAKRKLDCEEDDP